MASWGLAYEYGKNHYEDSWAKQEQNDRLQEERKLFDLKLAEDIAAQQTATKENSRVRDLRESMVEYGDKMKAGGAQGRQAFVDFMKTAGVDYIDLGNGKVGVSDGKGGVDQSSIIDMSKWNGDQIMSEAAKSVNTHRAEADLYKSQQEKNQDRADKFKLAEMQQQTQLNIAKMNNDAANYRAGLQAKTTLAAASLRASAGGRSGSGGGAGGSQKEHYNQDAYAKAMEFAVQDTFQNPNIAVTQSKDTGQWLMKDTSTGEEVVPSQGQMTDIQNAANSIYNAGTNFMNQNGGDQYNAILAAGSDWINNRSSRRGLEDFTAQYSQIAQDAVNRIPSKDYGLSYSAPVVQDQISGGTTSLYSPNQSRTLSGKGFNTVVTNSSPAARGVASITESFNYNPVQ